MNTHTNLPPNLSRRKMLESVSCGFGYLALAGMCAEAAPADPLAPMAAGADADIQRALLDETPLSLDQALALCP